MLGALETEPTRAAAITPAQMDSSPSTAASAALLPASHSRAMNTEEIGRQPLRDRENNDTREPCGKRQRSAVKPAAGWLPPLDEDGFRLDASA